MLKKLKNTLNSYAEPERITVLSSSFKTGPGDYAEGEKFIGVRAANIRKVVKDFYLEVDYKSIESLLKSKVHEERLLSLLILVERYKYFSKEKYYSLTELNRTYKIYLSNTQYINNWDLIDLTAHHIVGAHLKDSKNKEKVIVGLANSNDLWEKRIAMLSTFYYIREKDYKLAIKVAKILVYDEHDLIQKAVGWMLREIGKRDLKTEEKFLDKYHKTMPRTMLRYAIEKFSDSKRKYYM